MGRSVLVAAIEYGAGIELAFTITDVTEGRYEYV